MADNGTTDTLTPRQEKAIGYLLAEPSIRQAAQRAGIPEKTIYNWLGTPAFAEAYRLARREAANQAIAQLQQYSSTAARVIVSIMVKESTPIALRLSAARTVLEFAVKAVELEDLAARLEALERAYAAKL
jgi:hypothetical protein